jgi:hypothetical protein
MKASRSIKTALDRLAAQLDEFIVQDSEERGRVLVGTRKDPWGLGLTSKRHQDALAMLADYARTLENADEIRAAVRWTGSVPSSLAAHEESALNWLQGEA